MPAPSPAGRLASLDIFRGATIASMTLVNNPGDWSHLYPPLEHAAWHGWTLTDTVFPFFLWIVGLSMTLSTAKRLERGANNRQLLRHALRRALALFALGIGMGLVWNWNFSTLRLPGVLQRIAVCYFIATVILLWTRWRGQVLWLAGLLTVYWMAMTLIPVPGYGPGRLDLKVGNFAQWIDSLVLSGHMWSQTKPWDPEGLFSTLPAIGTCLAGVLAGHLLRSRLTPEQKTAWYCVGGALVMGAAEVLSIWMPINKNLWTPTFTLFMGGLASLCFGCWYWLADVQGWAGWFQPLRIFGLNAIAVFVASGEVAIACERLHVGRLSLGQWFFQTVCAPAGNPYIASELFALAHVALMLAIAWTMYRRGWFLKL
jgi:predicted acyltransferase